MISLFMLRFSIAARSRSRVRSRSGMFLMVMEATAPRWKLETEPYWFHFSAESIAIEVLSATGGRRRAWGGATVATA